MNFFTAKVREFYTFHSGRKNILYNNTVCILNFILNIWDQQHAGSPQDAQDISISSISISISISICFLGTLVCTLQKVRCIEVGVSHNLLVTLVVRSAY